VGRPTWFGLADQIAWEELFLLSLYQMTQSLPLVAGGSPILILWMSYINVAEKWNSDQNNYADAAIEMLGFTAYTTEATVRIHVLLYYFTFARISSTTASTGCVASMMIAPNFW
jgi:hypothetical protein